MHRGKRSDILKQHSVSKEETLQRFLDIFEASNEGLWEMAEDLQVNFFNRSFYNSFAISSEGSSLDEWMALVHPDDIYLFTKNVKQQISQKTSLVDSEYRVKNKAGEYRWIKAKGATRYSSQGDLIYMVGSHKDVTEEKQNQSIIYQAAYIDTQTGLMNANKLLQDLKDDFNRQVGAVVFIKLMNFTLYNTAHGSHAWNQIVQRLVACLGQVYTSDCQFYRHGECEIVIRITQYITCEEIAKSIQQLLEIFKNSNQFIHENYPPNLNVGVCIQPSSAESAQTLIHQAKLSMTYAQEYTDQHIAFFDDQIELTMKKNIHIKTAMKSALFNNEFMLKFQPIIQSQTGNIDSFEALVRWQSPIFGEIMPDEFIPVAEQNLNIIDIGYFVLEQACAFICQYNEVNDRRVKIAINVSGVQLLQTDFVERVLSTVNRFMLDSNNIVLEVTESVLLDSNRFANEQITRLREKGFAVSLDDFGTGYSSLNHFFTQPFTQLKIDRTVINQAMTTKEARAYIAFMNQLCQDKNIEVVAEGIETQEMYAAMKAIGVKLLQGYLFSKPVSADAAMKIR